MPNTMITANYSVNLATDFMVFCNAASTGAAGVTVTLPAAAGNAGRMFAVKRVNAKNASQDQCYVTPIGTVTGTTTMFLDAPDATSTNTNSTILVISDGNKWWIFTVGP